LSRWKRIAVDLRGCGASSAPADGYSMARYADDLVAVLDALGLKQAVFCGLSMGGYILFELLRRHPERVQGLVLADTRAEADSADGKRGRDEMVAVAEQEGAAGIATRMLSKLLAPATAQTQPEVVRQVEAMILRTPVPGIVGALRAMRERPDSRPLLPEIRVPTLVLVGGEDVLTPPAVARGMVEAIPAARYAEVPGAGHLAPLEQPLATSRVLMDFLNGLP
jgi:pimeloyl-ACP methyl ester carboxylesterase